MIVNVLFVCMGGNEKGVFPLCPAHSRFIAYPVRLLRGNLAGSKGLADLIAEHVRLPFLFPARDGPILCLGEQELRIGGLVVALIGRNKLPALGLVRVLPIVKPVFQRLSNCFPFADMVGNKPGYCHRYSSSRHEKRQQAKRPLSLIIPAYLFAGI